MKNVLDKIDAMTADKTYDSLQNFVSYANQKVVERAFRSLSFVNGIRITILEEFVRTRIE